MPVTLPDPLETARAEADFVIANRASMIDVSRVLADCPFADPKALLNGLEQFHAERMSKIPSTTKYPEAGVWVKQVIEIDKNLQEMASLSNRDMAIYRSLNYFLAYRGFKQAAAARQVGPEKCRVVYLPETDRGQAHLKNVDDPITHFHPDPKPVTSQYCAAELVHDGVGSGLHMDDEPAELFPLNPLKMMYSYCNNVPDALAFLTRYSQFWGGCNNVLQDRQKRSVAIEKCSVNFMEVFHPGPDGHSHVSGMVCRDPSSPQGKHQTKMRERYLKSFNQPLNGPDNTYWNFGYQFETKLAKGIKEMGPKVKYADVEKLFTTPWPEGLNKAGVMAHPKISCAEWTLVIYASLLDEKKTYRWQRTHEGAFPSKPEVFQF